MAFRGHRTFEDLIGEPPTHEERSGDWDPEEPSRFGRYAMRLWRPLLDVEKLEQR